ncbi:MAG TPA: O-antigen ligase family protein [bacterium]|nr:MAG: O-Antigen ligase [Parcubacteria group bacterium ADurb.Bin115]HNU81484.1 O-antigen ligase family protein [bacterium]HOD86972.1 O-antigen ligase family protein [bacterium]HPW05631.1 O-antigen ligase family protein [bacterium]HPY99265.1 O-antigen ligase family protein [bacterium]
MNLFKVKSPYFFIFSLIILVELLSFTAYFLPQLQIYLLITAFLAVFFLSLSSLESGLLVALAELVIGSKGHLFSASIFGVSVSLRLVIWLALMLASCIFIFRRGFPTVWRTKLFNFSYWPWVSVLAAFIILAFVHGYLRGNGASDIFTDGNAWFYLGLLLPTILAYSQIDDKQEQRLRAVFFTAIFWLSLKTLMLLFIFSHNISIMPDVYLWIRRSGVGEITAMGGGWYRIFIQSQIYIPIAFFLLLWPSLDLKTKKNPYLLIISLAVLLSVIIISMSRSFWLAFAFTAGVMAVISFRKKISLYLKALVYTGAALGLSLLLILVVVKFPYPNPQTGLSAAALSARLDFSSGEAAISSRWSLLPNLWQSINDSLFWGKGFGASVSYFSQDPRVLSLNPSGWYTTYAFEWAYLDTWLKLGLFGLIAYFAWLIVLIVDLLKKMREHGKMLPAAILAGLIFLMVVNIFTPYLNHPLGFGFLIFSSCFIKKNPL